MKKFALLLAIVAVLSSAAVAQTKRKPRTKANAHQVSTRPTPAENKPAEIETAENNAPGTIPAKKNERTGENSQTDSPSKKNAPAEKANKANVTAALPFVYEFSQPKFYISRVVIEHDAGGKGKITFKKQDWSDTQSDPLTISAQSLAKIQGLWNALKFLESTEVYQSPERDYAHLGTMKLRQSQGDVVREVEFNWTENQTAKDLTDEYKKLTEQYLWIFDINVARENQPLNSPQLIDRLDSLLARNQLSDPKQMLDFLREIANDERIPLIARNHTTKLIQKIEKLKEEKQ